MSPKQIINSISITLILTSGLLFATTIWQAHFAPTALTQNIFVEPDLPLYQVAPIPLLKPELKTLSPASNSAITSNPSPIFSDYTPTGLEKFLQQKNLFYQITPPKISATAAYIVDLDSATPLFALNTTRPQAPASTIKMMTALIARDVYPSLDQILTVTPQDITLYNSIGLKPQEKLTVADLLQALLISSSNEAAEVLANHSPGGRSDFLLKMNQLADQLHLEQTSFITPEGFDDDLQKSSARDLSLLAEELLQDEYLKKIVSTSKTTVSAATGEIHELINTNHFLDSPLTITLSDGKRQTATFSGVKTGTTPVAGEALVSLATIDQHQLLLVVLGSQNRYNDTTQLLTWVFNHYTWVDFPTNQPNTQGENNYGN